MARETLTLREKAGRALDDVLSIVAPRAAAARARARLDFAALRARQYAAAKSHTSHGDWNPAGGTVNQVIDQSRAKLLARTRQLVRDFPFFDRAVRILVDYTVGEGLTLQPRVIDPDGKPMTRLNKQIAELWEAWLEEADVAGRLHGLEMMRLAKRQDVECGEALVFKVMHRKPGRVLPFALQIIEPDRLNGLGLPAVPGKVSLFAGVEYDPATGAALGYHVTKSDELVAGGYDTIRVAAEHVVHTFETLRPGQLRGVTPFASGIILADSLHDYIGAEIDAARMASRFLAFVTAPDPIAAQAANGAIMDDHNNRKVEELGTAITQYLAPGEQVELASPNRQGTGFSPFARFILQTLAVSTNTTFELLSGDYSGMNYTTLRAARGDLVKTLRPMQKRHARGYCAPVYRAFMEYAVLSGKLEIPDFFAKPWPYLRAEWLDPGLEPLDPLKEGRAAADAVKSLLQSPQEWIRRRGRDPSDVLRETRAFMDEAKALGLAMGETSQAVQSAPSHLAKQPAGGLPDDEGEEV